MHLASKSSPISICIHFVEFTQWFSKSSVLSDNCLLPYVDFGWYFGVNTSAECDVIRYWIDFCKDFGVVALIGIVDVMTIVMIKITAPGMVSAVERTCT